MRVSGSTTTRWFYALALTTLLPISASASPMLYSIDARSDQLREIDPSNGSTISAVSITLAGETVNGGNGLATDPTTGILWGLLKLGGQGRNRELVTIDPGTGVATSIGETDLFGFAGIAFDAAGTLYGVQGDGGEVSETLFTLDTGDASSTLLLTLGNGDDGETIAFNPDDGFIYHASGHMNACAGGGVCFENINLNTLAITDIDISTTNLIDEETQALTYWDGPDVFLWAQDHGAPQAFLQVSADGTSVTKVGQLDHQSKGLAFVGETEPVPEPTTLMLLGLGLAWLGFAAKRRHLAAA